MSISLGGLIHILGWCFFVNQVVLRFIAATFCHLVPLYHHQSATGIAASAASAGEEAKVGGSTGRGALLASTPRCCLKLSFMCESRADGAEGDGVLKVLQESGGPKGNEAPPRLVRAAYRQSRIRCRKFNLPRWGRGRGGRVGDGGGCWWWPAGKGCPSVS